MLCFYNVVLLPLCCSVSLWAEEAAQQEAQEEDQEELRRRHRGKPRRKPRRQAFVHVFTPASYPQRCYLSCTWGWVAEGDGGRRPRGSIFRKIRLSFANRPVYKSLCKKSRKWKS